MQTTPHFLSPLEAVIMLTPVGLVAKRFGTAAVNITMRVKEGGRNHSQRYSNEADSFCIVTEI